MYLRYVTQKGVLFLVRSAGNVHWERKPCWTPKTCGTQFQCCRRHVSRFSIPDIWWRRWLWRKSHLSAEEGGPSQQLRSLHCPSSTITLPYARDTVPHQRVPVPDFANCSETVEFTSTALTKDGRQSHPVQKRPNGWLLPWWRLRRPQRNKSYYFPGRSSCCSSAICAGRLNYTCLQAFLSFLILYNVKRKLNQQWDWEPLILGVTGIKIWEFLIKSKTKKICNPMISPSIAADWWIGPSGEKCDSRHIGVWW